MVQISLNNYDSSLDRGASRIKEGVWVLTKVLFFYPRYPLPSVLRRTLLRAFGAEIGSGVVIRSGVDITFPWKLKVGDYSWIGEEVKLLNLATISIGSNCCISQRAFLCTGSHDFSCENFDLITQPITIEDSSWVAAQAFIGLGVRVGESSLVTASSVVTKNVPEFQMFGGNPAKTIKHLSKADSEERVQ